MEIPVLALGVKFGGCLGRRGRTEKYSQQPGLGSSSAAVTVGGVPDDPPLTLCIIWTRLLTSQGYLRAGRGTVIRVCRVVFRIK